MRASVSLLQNAGLPQQKMALFQNWIPGSGLPAPFGLTAAELSDLLICRVVSS